MNGRFWVMLILLSSSLVALATQTSTAPFIPVPTTASNCASGGAGGSVGCYHLLRSDMDVDVWTINRPPVNTHEATFPAIHPHAGDLVSVSAGGCVQTGGAGLTWKRYVRPMSRGQGDDSQYYGSIGIPGVIPMMPLRNALPHGAFEVPTEPGPDGFVNLQYLDDGYGDNGYWGRDDGWWEQCFRAPDAFVVITIQHGCVPTPVPGHSCLRGLPLDLAPTKLDDNGFPMNPDYTWQLLTESATPAWQLCSFNPKSEGMPEDSADLCRTGPKWTNTNEGRCGSGPWTGGNFWWTNGAIPGHLNFGTVAHIVEPREIPGAYISLDNHDVDDDYTWNVSRGDGTLDTESSPGKIQMEFDSDETIDHFVSPWWSAFHSKVPQKSSSSSNDAANAMIAGGSAIIIGLSGLDCEHGCLPELHPVYALALRLPDSSPTKEHWAYFARNWGNEGYCGTNQEPLPVDHLTIRIPMPNAVGINMTSWEMDTTDSAASATLGAIPAGGGAWISISLPTPDKEAVVSGEFSFQWVLNPLKQAIWPVRQIHPWWINQVPWSTEPARRNVEVESVLDQVIQKMSPAERQRIGALATGRKVTIHRRLPFKIVQGNPPGPSEHVIAARPAPDQVKQQALDAVSATVRQATQSRE
jgi:hypothetical protein